MYVQCSRPRSSGLARVTAAPCSEQAQEGTQGGGDRLPGEGPWGEPGRRPREGRAWSPAPLKQPGRARAERVRKEMVDRGQARWTEPRSPRACVYRALSFRFHQEQPRAKETQGLGEAGAASCRQSPAWRPGLWAPIVPCPTLRSPGQQQPGRPEDRAAVQHSPPRQPGAGAQTSSGPRKCPVHLAKALLLARKPPCQSFPAMGEAWEATPAAEHGLPTGDRDLCSTGPGVRPARVLQASLRGQA